MACGIGPQPSGAAPVTAGQGDRSVPPVPLSSGPAPASAAVAWRVDVGPGQPVPLILELVFQSEVVLTFLLICEVFKECPDLPFGKGRISTD